MPHSIWSYAERPDLDDKAIPSLDVWPEYNLHGDVVNPYWGALWDELSEFQLFMVDESDNVIAELQTGPVLWDGTDDGLTSGIDESLVDAIEARRLGTPVNTLCAFAAKIAPRAQGRGLATAGLEAMRELARSHGFAHLIAPVRPSFKHRYPLAAMSDYITWTRDDGLAFDPWIRVHQRLGARIVKAIPNSMRISGTVAEWESWTDMVFPVDGDYVFPDGLATVNINKTADLGVYYEPNVWIVHDV